MEKDVIVVDGNNIKNKIFTVRNVQVMIDKDLAELYEVETRVLKQAVNRNRNRFPSDFMFVLTNEEIDFMVSQSVIPSKKYFGGASPYVFTEQGVAMLSGVLSSQRAVDVNIQIMRAFVSMRKFISKNLELFARIDSVERKQAEFHIQTEKQFEKIFDAIEDKTFKKKQGIFFDGQIFDAYTFVSDIIRSATTAVILIDNYVDDSVLTLFTKRKKRVQVTILTREISRQLVLDLEKYNSQYSPIDIKKFEQSHDRFLIIDDKEVYHFGASLKDLGKKWFAFSKFDKGAFNLLDKLRLRR